MKWLLAWLILNALILVWRVLVVWPQLKAKNQFVGVGGTDVDGARTPANRIHAAARVAGHGVL
jgi:hypothetical protein